MPLHPPTPRTPMAGALALLLSVALPTLGAEPSPSTAAWAYADGATLQSAFAKEEISAQALLETLTTRIEALTISRSATVPVSWISRSAKVDLPWSICATMEKLRMRESSVMLALGYACSRRSDSARRANRKEGSDDKPAQAHALPARVCGISCYGLRPSTRGRSWNGLRACDQDQRGWSLSAGLPSRT